jgi:hypothetical protein
MPTQQQLAALLAALADSMEDDIIDNLDHPVDLALAAAGFESPRVRLLWATTTKPEQLEAAGFCGDADVEIRTDGETYDVAVYPPNAPNVKIAAARLPEALRVLLDALQKPRAGFDRVLDLLIASPFGPPGGELVTVAAAHGVQVGVIEPCFEWGQRARRVAIASPLWRGVLLYTATPPRAATVREDITLTLEGGLSGAASREILTRLLTGDRP